MKCAIMQPTFLPWVGYFNLMSNVDVFVFLDDVQLQRRSWQVRNRVLLNGNEAVITVPLVRAPRETHICDVVPAIDQAWLDKTFRLLDHAYGRAPFWEETLSILREELFLPAKNLADLNMRVIERIAANIGLSAITCRSSDIVHTGRRSDHLLSICQSLGCTTYVSPMGSQQYLEEDGVFADSSVNIAYNDHTPVAYPQAKSVGFVPYLSVVDLLANVGLADAPKYVRSGN